MKTIKPVYRFLLSLAFLVTPSLSFAQEELNGANTAWILTSTALVLFMTLPGLSLFYAGLVRTKNVLSVLMQCFSIAVVISLLWLVVGYSIAFGPAESAWWGGLSKTLFNGVGIDSMSGDIPETVFASFQMTFAIITPALIVGAFVERIKFSAMLLFSILWTLLVYFPVANWVWGGGWLGQRGLIDFAGGTVVHVTAGVGGIVGTFLAGILVSANLGVFSGNGYAEGMTMGSQVAVQLLGILAVGLYTAALTFGIVKLVGVMTGGVRVSPEQEQQGLDITDHDEKGYSM